jgi:hypothetical protein
MGGAASRGLARHHGDIDVEAAFWWPTAIADGAQVQLRD